jgi:colicin import membrane protein
MGEAEARRARGFERALPESAKAWGRRAEPRPGEGPRKIGQVLERSARGHEKADQGRGKAAEKAGAKGREKAAEQAAEKAGREKAAREKAAREKAAREKAAREKAEEGRERGREKAEAARARSGR